MAGENQVRKRLASFRFAFKGIAYMMKTQRNAQIHFIAAVAAIVLGFVYKIDFIEWCLVVIAIGLVLMAEMFNTAIEFLIDLVSPEIQNKAGKAKDIAAGAVLITTISAAIIGSIIFLPKMF